MEVALLSRQESCSHLSPGRAQRESRRQTFAVAESAGAGHRDIPVRQGINHRWKQGHGVDRLPGSVKPAFVTGGDDAVHTRFGTSKCAFDRGYDMQPGKSGLFYLVPPGERVTGRSKYHFEMIFHLRIFIDDPYRRIDENS